MASTYVVIIDTKLKQMNFFGQEGVLKAFWNSFSHWFFKSNLIGRWAVTGFVSELAAAGKTCLKAPIIKRNRNDLKQYPGADP
jgi:hypothetical protein